MRYTNKVENEYFSNIVPNEHHNAIKPCLNKLGQYEDIDEELGVDWPTLFKALKNGFWQKSTYINSTYYYYSPNEYEICLDVKRKAIRVIDRADVYVQSLFGFESFGKIWSLNKEELE